MMTLRTFVKETPDAGLLREMIGFAAERLMELEVGVATGPGYGKKSPLRQAQRSGYRDRDSCIRKPVSLAWRTAVRFWCARIAPASGWNSGTKRLRLLASVPGETGTPVVRQPRRDPAQRAQAGTVLEEEARPEAGPVGRSGEQSRHRRRRQFKFASWRYHQIFLAK